MVDNDLIPRHTCSQPDAAQRIGATLLPQVSPVAWTPIHRFGSDACTKAPEVRNSTAIMQAWAQAPFRTTSRSHLQIIPFIAVGMPVTRHPLHRSGREALPHPAPTLGMTASCIRPPGGAQRRAGGTWVNP